MLKNIFERSDFVEALRTARGDSADIKTISVILPEILENKDTAAAYALVMNSVDACESWLPESMVMLGMQNLTASQQLDMAVQIFGEDLLELTGKDIADLCDVSGMLGQASLSFPAWRFVSIGFAADHKSLLERVGFKRLVRENDVRDPELPKFNPQRDEFGTGFRNFNDDIRLEYRRAYLAISSFDQTDPVHIIIRNSSYFFGRDRLPAPALVSFEPFTNEELDHLTIEQLNDPELFQPWQDVARKNSAAELQSKISTIMRNMDQFEEIDKGIVKNLVSEDLSPLLAAFMKEQLDNHIKAGKDGAPFYLGLLREGMLPWAPFSVLSVDEKLIEVMKDHEIGDAQFGAQIQNFYDQLSDGAKPVLLSSPLGDYPVKPKVLISNNREDLPQPGTPIN